MRMKASYKVVSPHPRRPADIPLLVSRLGEADMVAIASTPPALAGRIATEQTYWQGVVRATGIRAES